MTLRLRSQTFDDNRVLLMAIVNRTPDSFYDRGATWAEDKARDRVRLVVEEGAEIVDIGGVKAAPGTQVDEDEELRRVVAFVGSVRSEFPDVVISVDTWRSTVARAACQEGADLINDAWGGFDLGLVDVAAEFDAALVCTHTGGATPRTRPHRVEYQDVVADVLRDTVDYATRAVRAGVDSHSIVIDPAHDFGKNTFHSLEITRRLEELTSTKWPVLVSLSNKDFVGESLGRAVDERQLGTLAATALCVLKGARILRVHEIAQTRQVVDMVLTIEGRLAPERAIRGLA